MSRLSHGPESTRCVCGDRGPITACPVHGRLALDLAKELAGQPHAGPAFGAWFENVLAGVGNPTRRGMYVETIRRHRDQMNPGTWWRLTDGQGRFWESRPENLEAVERFGDAKQLMGEAIYGCIDWNRRAYGTPATDEDAWWFAETALKALQDKGWRLMPPAIDTTEVASDA